MLIFVLMPSREMTISYRSKHISFFKTHIVRLMICWCHFCGGSPPLVLLSFIVELSLPLLPRTLKCWQIYCISIQYVVGQKMT